ncbi:MAG TPA: RNA polymerase sigma factor [Polyangiaceae bacterium]|nr:RNA polymerase sigma factor [Polyangiaceae bacterium]
MTTETTWRRTRSADRASENPGEPSEAELVALLLTGDRDAFELLMRKNNQRLFRVARSIVLEDAEAEDVVQTAYLAAFRGVATFAGRSSVATWLTRIVINEALARRRERLRYGRFASAYDLADELSDRASNPEDKASLQELTRLTESALDGLPANYRLVLMLRQVEGLSGEETAASLGVTEEVVRVRLHRARAMLRDKLVGFDPNASSLRAFGFGGERCNRIVDRVLTRTTVPAEARVAGYTGDHSYRS